MVHGKIPRNSGPIYKTLIPIMMDWLSLQEFLAAYSRYCGSNGYSVPVAYPWAWTCWRPWQYGTGKAVGTAGRVFGRERFCAGMRSTAILTFIARIMPLCMLRPGKPHRQVKHGKAAQAARQAQRPRSQRTSSIAGSGDEARG